VGRLLKETLLKSSVIKINEYEYFVHPATDGIPSVESALLTEICDEICNSISISNIDVIVVPEAMGIPVGTVLSLKLKKPLNIIRKTQYGLKGELRIQQRTGYGGAFLYINGIKRGDRVLLVDDVISTGGTIVSIVNGLKTLGAQITDIVVIVEKGEIRREIERQINQPIKSLIKVDIVNGKVVVK
jgi:adenine phosphoribosyltransferase